MKRKGLVILVLVSMIGMSFTMKETLSDLLKKYNTESIPYIYHSGLSELKSKKTPFGCKRNKGIQGESFRRCNLCWVR